MQITTAAGAALPSLSVFFRVAVLAMCAALASGQWMNFASLPGNLGEVAVAYIGGNIYVVGQGNSNTYSYNVGSGSWNSYLAVRPYVGNHHAVVLPSDGNMWLVGGFNGGSEGKVGEGVCAH